MARNGSPRRACTSAAKTMVIARPAAASDTRTVAMPVSAGTTRPSAPRISRAPIPWMTLWGKSSA